MLRSEERDTWRVSLPLARTSLVTYAHTICYYQKNVLYFTSNCVSGRIFLSTIQADNRSIDTRRTFSVVVLYGKNAGRNDNLLHEGKARACVVFSLKRSLTFPSNLWILSTSILYCTFTSFLVMR